MIPRLLLQITLTFVAQLLAPIQAGQGDQSRLASQWQEQLKHRWPSIEILKLAPPDDFVSAWPKLLSPHGQWIASMGTNIQPPLRARR